MSDPIDPSHYRHASIEAIDVIEAWRLGFHLGNVTKYICRAGHKGDALTDLRKARWYLDREIKQRQGEAVKQPNERQNVPVVSINTKLIDDEPLSSGFLIRLASKIGTNLITARVLLDAGRQAEADRTLLETNALLEVIGDVVDGMMAEVRGE